MRELVLYVSDEQWRVLEAAAKAAGKRVEEVAEEWMATAIREQQQAQVDKAKRLAAVKRLAQMSLPVSDWQQMEYESTPSFCVPFQPRFCL